MELQREEQLRKDEARKVEILRQREERDKYKAAAAQVRATERKAFEQEFRHTLVMFNSLSSIAFSFMLFVEFVRLCCKLLLGILSLRMDFKSEVRKYGD